MVVSIERRKGCRLFDSFIFTCSFWQILLFWDVVPTNIYFICWIQVWLRESFADNFADFSSFSFVGCRHLRLQRRQGGWVDLHRGTDHLRREKEWWRLVGGCHGGDHRPFPRKLCGTNHLTRVFLWMVSFKVCNCKIQNVRYVLNIPA